MEHGDTASLLHSLQRHPALSVAPSRSSLVTTNGMGLCFSGGHPPISGTDKFLQIFRVSLFDISACRGIASIAPVVGLDHSE